MDRRIRIAGGAEAMSTPTQAPPSGAVEYPDSDGQPMSDNTLQFEWIVTIKEGLGALFADRPDVFVAGDLLWYPVEGDPTTRAAPDALVAFGRPKGYRGSYKQWEEGGIAPQVVFEVQSPGNRPRDLIRKFRFYDEFGVEEYYLYDPDHNDLSGWRRVNDRLQDIDVVDGWTSPHLGVRFELTANTLRLIRPDGQLFLTYLELFQSRDAERRRADEATQRAEAERQRAERLAARLRELGIDLE
jgi:Uma2 family endonuclease